MVRNNNWSSDDAPSTVAHPIETGSDARDFRAVAPAITILWHYDPRRVGQTAALGLGLTEVSRSTPPFDLLRDEAVSRRPFFEVEYLDGGALIKPIPSKTSVIVDGLPLLTERRVAPDHLRTGVIIVLAERIVICLHRLRTPSLRVPTFGLVGNSDLIEGVRREIKNVADFDDPVLIRGESGSGKELVARAIAAESKMPEPFIRLNMATAGASTAASEFFGHEKGAFTGATEARAGHFVDAEGGTLFMDEIGAIPLDIQQKFLRVLDDKEVHALGAKRARKVKVRVLAATDADLEKAVANGTFSEALFHRFENTIYVPPLSQRREDIGALFLHFLRGRLEETGELDRLDPRDIKERPWLYANDFARIALAPFPGNLRRLRAIASRLVRSSRGQPFARLEDDFEQLLAGAELPAEPSPEAPGEPGQPTNQQIKRALVRNEYKVSAAARDLFISRGTLYARACPAGIIRMPEDVPDADVMAAYERHQGIIAKMAVELQVSQQSLQTKVRSLLRRKR